MASGPITSWQIEGGKVEEVTHFAFLVSTVTQDDDCSHEIKRCMFLGRKTMRNLDKDLYSQSYGFSSYHVQMWELDHKEGWAPKNWCFELWCWRRLLRVPWTARRSNQSILKEINPEYSLEDLKLKVKLQYFGHLMQRPNSLEKSLMLRKTVDRRRTGQQRVR